MTLEATLTRNFLFNPVSSSTLDNIPDFIIEVLKKLIQKCLAVLLLLDNLFFNGTVVYGLGM